jgi:pentatricopeptide repeat protein
MESAASVLAFMDRGGAQPPNAYSLCIMMRAYGARRQLKRADELWGRLRERQWLDTVGLNTYISACMACGEQRRALQAFQMVKAESPRVLLDKVTFGALINGLTTPKSPRAATRRALQLWAEMRDLGISPDAGIVASLFAGIRRHLDVEDALRLRRELLAMGWKPGMLRAHDARLRESLPTLSEVVGDLPKWAALGVRPRTTLNSEVGVVLNSEVGELMLDGGDPDLHLAAPDDPKAPLAGAEPASPGQEIWERKGWNQIDGGWRGFF